MQADLILCDHAEAVNGKLYINGGGWNLLYAVGLPVSVSLAILIDVDWNETNIRHELRAELRTLDGELVRVKDNDVSIPVTIEVGRPPGIRPGSSLLAPVAVGVQGLVLDEGGYVWHLLAADNELARRPFQVSSPPQVPGFGLPSR